MEWFIYLHLAWIWFLLCTISNIKPPFGRICFTFSKHLKQIQVKKSTVCPKRVDHGVLTTKNQWPKQGPQVYEQLCFSTGNWFSKKAKTFSLEFAKGGPSSNGKSGLNFGFPKYPDPSKLAVLRTQTLLYKTASNPSIQESLVILKGWWLIPLLRGSGYLVSG